VIGEGATCVLTGLSEGRAGDLAANMGRPMAEHLAYTDSHGKGGKRGLVYEGFAC
jgi:hypothetical protein